MSKERPDARFVRAGEFLAIDTGVLRSGPGAFFWMFGPASPENDRRSDVSIVHVRGPLDHHSDAFDDNYESIICRVEEAFSGEDVVKRHERKARDRRTGELPEDYERPDAVAPSAVILCIDSPGGVVSGLNETVKSLQKMRNEAGIPLVAYVNEMAASAAYALACSCDKIYAPKSAILGSVGVISTMISQDAKNKKDGFDVRLITSGARKADGHVHAPISGAAVDVERGRVDKLALDFFKIVSKARGIPIDRVASFQAGIFLGGDAKKRGLADRVCSLDECVASLSKGKSESAHEEEAAKGNETDRREAKLARSGTSSKKPLDSSKKSSSVRHTLARSGTHSAETDRMSSKSILALIKKQEAAIAKELASKADPEKLAALYADLSAYKKTEKHVEHTKSEEYDDEDDDEDSDEDDEEDDDDEDEKKSSKSSATSKEDDEEEEEAKKSKKSSKASKATRPDPTLSALAASTGVPIASLTPGKLKAVFEQAAQFATLSTDVATLKATQTKATKNALIDEAVAQRRITRKQAATLRDKKPGFVNDYLAMHKTALVNIDEEALLVPDSTTNADVPANVRALVEQAIALNGLKGEDADKFRAQAYEDQRKASGMPDGRH